MIFTKTAIGYSHIKTGKPCQDYSASYSDETRSIITACDGHGGDVYIRSDKGSRFASNALIKVLGSLSIRDVNRLKSEPSRNKLRLNLLCEWNSQVEKDLSEHPIRKSELKCLSDKDVHRLKTNRIKAYGSTMIGAMQIGNKIVTAMIGDGGAFFVKKGKIKPIFEEDDDEPVANLTYSLCEEDAYDHIKVGVFDLAGIDGVMLTSDGVINPYTSYTNFERSFVSSAVDKLRSGKANELEQFIVNMGKAQGNGDDVTLSVLLKDKKLRAKKTLSSESDLEPYAKGIESKIFTEHKEEVKKTKKVVKVEVIQVDERTKKQDKTERENNKDKEDRACHQ